MSRKLAYIGYGPLGKQVSGFIHQTNPEQLDEIYFDDELAAAGKPNSFAFNTYAEDRFSNCEFIICLGYKHLEKKTRLLAELKKLGRNILTFIHPSSIINPTASIGAGVIIYPGCNVDQHVVLEDAVLLNNSVIVSHDSIVGEGSFLAPGVVVSGNVKIGKQTFIGSGAVISNGLTIGEAVIAGVGTVITENIGAGSSVIGSPMRLLPKKIQLQ